VDIVRRKFFEKSLEAHKLEEAVASIGWSSIKLKSV
jgi:hypothetical protein